MATPQAGVELLPGRLKSLPLEAGHFSTCSLGYQHKVQQGHSKFSSVLKLLRQRDLVTTWDACPSAGVRGE